MKHKIMLLLISFILVFSLVGCGKTTLSDFGNEMNEFLKDITKVDDQMNKIDPDSEDAVKEMLECLDAMNKSFKSLAAIDVPNEFLAIESLADEASEYMDLALENYTQAFINPAAYDSAKGEVANQYLKRALLRKEYIAIILQGGTPEGEGVIISYDTTNDENTLAEPLNEKIEPETFSIDE